MKTSSLYFLLIAFYISQTLSAQIKPSNHWLQLDTSDGLVANEIKAIQIEDQENIWIGTTEGLSHFDGSAFTNYTRENSSLNSNNIKSLELANDQLWLLTDSGLSSFDGSTFTNYTTKNGLNAFPTAIASTSNDTLWVGSFFGGVSKFNGVKFIHYPTERVRDVQCDAFSRVYLLERFFDITDTSSFEPSLNLNIRYSIYDNGVWTSYKPIHTRFKNGYDLPKRTFSGDFVLLGDPGYYKVDFPFTLNEKKLDYSLVNGGVGDFEIDQDEVWLSSIKNNSVLAYGGRGTTLNPYFVNTNIYTGNKNPISIDKNLVLVGTPKGLFYKNRIIQKLSATEEMQVNSIRTHVFANRSAFSIFMDEEPTFEAPKGSGINGIYSSNFIVAAKERGQTNYRLNSKNALLPEYAPWPINSTVGLNKGYLVKVSKSEIETHKSQFSQSGYTVPEGIAEWPAAGDTSVKMAVDLAPFVDINNDSCYNPNDGDYPAIKGDEAIYWINHTIHDEDGKYLKFEYHWMLYGYDQRSDTALNQSLFLQYSIINRDTVSYDSIKVGLLTDFDIGYPFDDFIGCDSNLNLSYSYNGELYPGVDSLIAVEREQTPAAIGVKFLTDSMVSSMAYTLGTNINQDPKDKAHWLNYLNGSWGNGKDITYGGDGFNMNSSDSNTKFMFTGNPATDSGWTEKTALNGLPNLPGDRRNLMSIPSFSLEPGERKTIELAYAYVRDLGSNIIVGENVPSLIKLLNQAKHRRDTISLPRLAYSFRSTCSATSIQEHDLNAIRLDVFPIPASQEIKIQSKEIMQLLELYDVKGAKLLSKNVGAYSYDLDVSHYNKGGYFIRVQLTNGQLVSRKIILGD